LLVSQRGATWALRNGSGVDSANEQPLIVTTSAETIAFRRPYSTDTGDGRTRVRVT
jgi:hypothetical protein